jgi:hypothetical protein
MNATDRYGVPMFTDGVFGVPRAQDDLGVEEVGAGLLRRLIPGVIQNTPNASYYSFYPYLLWKWEQRGGAIERREFVNFYRRQEAAFAVACALHPHRGGVALNGINGALTSGVRARELGDGVEALDLDEHARGYMDTRLGGYGLFYAAALQDARLVIAGATGLVDRVTEHGAAVARVFAERFEHTTYAQEYLNDGRYVPTAVLRELGDAVCLCTVPERPDHQLLLDTFFGEPLNAAAWEERRLVRVESLSLFLEFHHQRPDGAADGLAAWRRALIDPRFSDGTPWRTGQPERRESWRAYQLREIAVLALTTIWSLYLAVLRDRGRAGREELVGELCSWLTVNRLGFEPQMALGDAIETVGAQLPDPVDLIAEVEPVQSQWQDEPERALCRVVRVLCCLSREIDRGAPGFDELLDEGGSHRWSLMHVRGWLRVRAQTPLVDAVGELISALHHQHVRIALTKIATPSAQNLRRSSDRLRDPFNFAEDEGVLRPLRGDEPTWSGARYDVINHLLWSLGLLDSPRPPIRLTELGRVTLAQSAGNA